MARLFNRGITHKEVADLIGNKPVPTILEIGCNDGTDTLRFLKTFPGAQVYCFEPDPRAATRWFQQVNDTRAHLHTFALSDANGMHEFYGSGGVPPERHLRPGTPKFKNAEWDMSGSLLRPTGHYQMSPWTTFPESRRFHTTTMRLDSWLEQTPAILNVDFIWMDVQGAEALVLRGASEVLHRIRWIYTECYEKEMYAGQPNLDGILAVLPGWKLEARFGWDNVLLRSPDA